MASDKGRVNPLWWSSPPAASTFLSSADWLKCQARVHMLTASARITCGEKLPPYVVHVHTTSGERFIAKPEIHEHLMDITSAIRALSDEARTIAGIFVVMDHPAPMTKGAGEITVQLEAPGDVRYWLRQVYCGCELLGDVFVEADDTVDPAVPFFFGTDTDGDERWAGLTA